MAKLLKLRRGTTTQHASFTGAEGEVTIDTDKDTAVVHDGSTQAGRPLAREDMNNVSSASIAGRLGTDSITPDKIAAGTLPTDVTVASANLVNGTIATADLADNSVTVDKIELGTASTDGKFLRANNGADPSFETLPATSVLTYPNGSTAVTVSTQNEIQIGSSNSKVVFDTDTSNTYEISFAGPSSLTKTSAFTLPEDGSNNQALITNGSGALSFSGPFMPLAGGTFSDDVIFAGTNYNATWDKSADKFVFDDNAKAIFGTGGDLSIYHDGTLNIIDCVNGNLQLMHGAEKMICAVPDGQVELWHDNSKKLETTSAGVTVTGDLVATHFLTNGAIGRDSNDNITFTDDTQMDITINGNNEFRFEADGDFHADGDVIAYSTTTASDERLKENIEIVSDPIEKVEALRGVTFDWKKDGTSSAGVIAQDVMKVLPEAVKEVQGLNDNESHLAVNYHALTSILIESVKELSARVKELEAK